MRTRHVLCAVILLMLAVSACRPSPENNYLKGDRLQDVVALIQLLALEPGSGYKPFKHIEEKLGNKNWQAIVEEHKEFFRIVPPEGKELYPTVILHFRATRAKDKIMTPPLDAQETASLINVAIELHKSQLSYESNSLQRRSINQVSWTALGTLLLSAVSIFGSRLMNLKKHQVYKMPRALRRL